MLRESSGLYVIVKHIFRIFDAGILLAEFEVIIVDCRVLEVGFVKDEFLLAGCGGLARMIHEIFGDTDRIEMLGYVSKQIGRIKPVRRIYWVERILIQDKRMMSVLVRAFVYRLEKRILRCRGILIFGYYAGVCNLFSVLDEMKFRGIGGMNYRFVGKPDRKRGIRFELYLPGF